MSYDQLITEALLNAKDRMLTLKDIYLTIAAKHPFYKIEEKKGWKNCIRHNLSLSKNFTKSSDDKGSFWKLESGAESILLLKPDKKSALKIKGSQNTASPPLATTSQQVVQVLPLNNGILTPPQSPGTYPFFKDIIISKC